MSNTICAFNISLNHHSRNKKKSKESTKASKQMEPPTWLLKHTLEGSSYLSIQFQQHNRFPTCKTFKHHCSEQQQQKSSFSEIISKFVLPLTFLQFSLQSHSRIFLCLHSIFKCFAASRYCSRNRKKNQNKYLIIAKDSILITFSKRENIIVTASTCKTKGTTIADFVK